MDDTQNQQMQLNSEQLIRTIFNGCGAACLLLDESGFFDCNEAALALFKSPNRQDILQQHPSFLSPVLQPCGRDSFVLANEYIAKTLKYDSQVYAWQHKRFDESEFSAEIILKAIRLQNKKVVQFTIFDVSERQHLEKMLAQEHENCRALFNVSNALNLLIDQNQVLDCNDEVLRVLKYKSQVELIGKSATVFSPNYQPCGRSSVSLFAEHYALTCQKGRHKYEWLLRRADGGCFPAEIYMAVIRFDNKELVYMQFEDVSKIKIAEQELRIAAIAFELHEGILLTDAQGKIVRVNHAFCRNLGFSPEQLVGQKPKVFSSGRHDKQFYKNMWVELITKGKWQGEIWNRRKDGVIYPEWLSISSIKAQDGQVSHYIGIYSDAVRSDDNTTIYRLAYYDVLTNLPNRRLLVDRTEHALIACKRSACFGALVYLDLDNFKVLNDTRGHDVGDELLVEVAKRLQLVVREGDTIARMGGDEFVVLLENLSEDAITATKQVNAITDKLIESIAYPFEIQGKAFKCSTSVGVRLFNLIEHSVDTLFKQADMAMYEAKNAGGNGARFYRPQMQVTLNRRAQMQNDLYLAIKRFQLTLHYQIQVNNELEVEGAEALVRWHHPKMGAIPTSTFIPLAEETDIIFLLGFWVLESVCRQLILWQNDVYLSQITVSVNISIRQFKQPGFVAQMSRLINQYGINPKRLNLELNENLLLTDVKQVMEKMAEIRELGIVLSMDNFGSGYTSLAHLKQLPLSQIKIARSFIKNITDDETDLAVAKTIIELGKNLHVNVLAEGVETQAQADMLASLGCYRYQGFLYSEALQLDDFEHLLSLYR